MWEAVQKRRLEKWEQKMAEDEKARFRWVKGVSVSGSHELIDETIPGDKLSASETEALQKLSKF